MLRTPNENAGFGACDAAHRRSPALCCRGPGGTGVGGMGSAGRTGRGDTGSTGGMSNPEAASFPGLEGTGTSGGRNDPVVMREHD
jgi:hypothetical protein